MTPAARRSRADLGLRGCRMLQMVPGTYRHELASGPMEAEDQDEPASSRGGKHRVRPAP